MGIRDFSGKVVRAHEEAGWTLHCKVTVWKDPVVEMTRTNANGLLYKQLKKDSSKSRVGLPDYVLVFRAPGENEEPIAQDEKLFPVSQWQQWASPVWMDIKQTNTLNVAIAREDADERHLCPLQLDLISRAVHLWSNPGDTVLSPFMGVGSEGVESVKAGRRFIGIELKKAYWERACRYIDQANRTDVSLSRGLEGV